MYYGQEILSKLLLTGIFCIFSLSSPIIPFQLCYISIFLTSLLIILGVSISILRTKTSLSVLIKNNIFYGKTDYLLSMLLLCLWFFIICSWLYGVGLGLFHGVPAHFVFRNFFGLLIYSFFPIIIIVQPSIKSLIHTIILASIIQFLHLIFGSYQFIEKYNFTTT